MLYDVDPNGYDLYLNASDEYVVWSRYDNISDSRDIFYYDLNGPNAPIQLTNDAAVDLYPKIVGNYIVWQKGVENEAEIYYYDLSAQDTVVRLTNNDFEDRTWSLSASGTTIAWQGGYFMQNSTDEIFMAQLSGATTASQDLSVPAADKLDRIFPNPACDEATVEYTVANTLQVSIRILNMNGKLLKVLADEIMPAGTHQVSFNTADLPQGIYLCALQVNNSKMTKRITVIR